MKRMVLFAACVVMAVSAAAQELPARWDELTATDWPKALDKAGRTAILPIGILEKHGPHGPIGSDLIQAREIAARAAKTEYVVVFPDYAGEGATATRELGQLLTEQRVQSLIRALRTVKADVKTLELQKEFFDRVLK